eukprot:CAMPEP_0194494136 /NCGR_PEP_ID=MMETSP0253-20130528/12134_1 /TAXON_ID=2966 /ORGANISM="Noctiluca scintillans" /LENGTH=78 /DNA_ID=CAMNT_0039335207 /DNA_START=45 /DNA_END=281 /DNA_ORIENTATION=+
MRWEGEDGSSDRVDSEDEELPGEENQWCPLLDLSYHHCVGPVLLQSLGTAGAVRVSGTCMFAILIAPVVRDSITKHLW